MTPKRVLGAVAAALLLFLAGAAVSPHQEHKPAPKPAVTKAAHPPKK